MDGPILRTRPEGFLSQQLLELQTATFPTFFSDWRCTHLSEEVSVNTMTRVRVGMCCKQKFISEIYSKRLASKIYPICTRHITFLLFQQVAQISHVHFKLFVSEVQQEADNSGRIKILPSGFRLNTYCSIWKSLLVEPRWAPLAISLVLGWI